MRAVIGVVCLVSGLCIAAAGCFGGSSGSSAGAGNGNATAGATGGTGGGAGGSSSQAWVDKFLSARTRLVVCDPDTGSFASDDHLDLILSRDLYESAVDCINEASDCAGVVACPLPDGFPSSGPCEGGDRCDGNTLVTCVGGLLVRLDCSVVPGGTCRSYQPPDSEESSLWCVVGDQPCAEGENRCEGSIAIVCDTNEGIPGYYYRYDCADAFGATCQPGELDCSGADGCHVGAPDCIGGDSGVVCSPECEASRRGDGVCQDECDHAGCNYDDGDCTGSAGTGGAGGTGGTQCSDGTTSTPGEAGDPCPQLGTMCAAVGGSAVACCAGTTWAKNATGTTDCKCTTAPVMCGVGGWGMWCGDGAINAPEQCDGAMLGATSTCSALGMGLGTLSCDPATCRYDTSMCTGSVPTGGTGAGGSGP